MSSSGSGQPVEFVYPPRMAADDNAEVLYRVVVMAIRDGGLSNSTRAYMLRKLRRAIDEMLPEFETANDKPQMKTSASPEAKEV